VLAFFSFSEMVFGFQPLSKVWTDFWRIIPPENPQLAAALYITLAVAAPAKGALCVMAVFGVISKNPFALTVLFLSTALVPPLNLVFPFRQQDFLSSSAPIVGIIAILWMAFFLFKEPTPQTEQRGTRGSGQLPPSRWETFQYLWFAVNSAALTFMALLLLFGQKTALSFILPCLSSIAKYSNGWLLSLTDVNMHSGIHLLALAAASWTATVYCRHNPALRKALAAANTLNAGLFTIFPIRQITQDLGGDCATSSILIVFVPLFVGWVLYVIVDAKRSFSLAESRTR
jgi:hypothetical protein